MQFNTRTYNTESEYTPRALWQKGFCIVTNKFYLILFFLFLLLVFVPLVFSSVLFIVFCSIELSSREHLSTIIQLVIVILCKFPVGRRTATHLFY